MKDLIFRTNTDLNPLIIRILLGIVIFVHGAQKLFGWFGGSGFENTMNYLTETMNLPWAIAFLTILLESIGAFALIVGLATRFLAISFTIIALGIVFTTHFEHGFFMNWFGNQAGEGYEYFLLWLGMSVALIFSGGGRYALDRLIAKK
ncbi:DoxX family protein [Ichthyenterobacterium magnum]|uniref:Putative oxidoreductase n=1 Tax=Ichthyenterobacterium magnum TaxID=1230530 RepID=A0A420DV99_9FLAO|nr:DoxX family protein [Ichthyenterobacterium magnum]RKE98133.1 putative oxidoreductase [Ichthyenterobacterium magnum]